MIVDEDHFNARTRSHRISKITIVFNATESADEIIKARKLRRIKSISVFFFSSSMLSAFAMSEIMKWKIWGSVKEKKTLEWRDFLFIWFFSSFIIRDQKKGAQTQLRYRN